MIAKMGSTIRSKLCPPRSSRGAVVFLKVTNDQTHGKTIRRIETPSGHCEPVRSRCDLWFRFGSGNGLRFRNDDNAMTTTTTKQPKWPVCEKCGYRWTDTRKLLTSLVSSRNVRYSGLCKMCKRERVNERNEVIAKPR